MTLAFVFPGQGSQSVGMLDALAGQYPIVQQTFAEAATALGFDLWKLVTQGPVEELNRTQHTQPAMLAAGVATWRVWRARGGEVPAYMAGHSLGEYSALTCAGALDFGDAVRLVADRAHFMQEAVPAGQGAMAAIIGLPDDVVQAICHEAAQEETLEAVNFNLPGQVVIAGHAAAVARGLARAKEAGAKRALLLPVSVPAHSSLMAPAAHRLAERLQSVSVTTPAILVLHNAHVRAESAPEKIKEALVRQLTMPVPWVKTIETLGTHGVTHVGECGPGKVLTGLNKRIAAGMACYALNDPHDIDKQLAEVRPHAAIGRQ